MNPEAYGHAHGSHQQEDVFDESYNDDYSGTEVYPSEIDTPSLEPENLPDNESVEPMAQETAQEERLGDLDERLRLLNIGRDSAMRDIENWQSSPHTNPADFQYKLPHMKIRLNTAEHAISSSTLDRDLVSAQAETPEATNEVVRTFIRNQVLEGKTKSQRESIRGIDKEEATLQDKLTRYEKTIESSQKTLDGEDSDDTVRAGELSVGQRRDLLDKIHQTSDMYETTLAEKMSGDFGGRRAEFEAEIKATQELGVPDDELPRTVQDDPDFAACLHEANFSYSDDSETYKRRTNHDPDKEALTLFSQRFPHKADFYRRLTEASSSPDQNVEATQEIPTAPTTPKEIIGNLKSEASAEAIEETPFTAEDLTLERSWKQREELATHITGLDIEDPQMVDRLIEDKAVIRNKYKLPPIELRKNDPGEYERALRQRLKEEEVDFKDSADMGRFFDHNPFVGGVHSETENFVGVRGINRNDFDDYYSSLGTMEHELVHALQHKYSPQMPIELMEYEAYIGSNFNLDTLKAEENPSEALREVIFDDIGIMGSVKWWYTEEGRKRGEMLAPAWDKDAIKTKRKIEKTREFIKNNDSTEMLPRAEFEFSLGDELIGLFREHLGENETGLQEISLADIKKFDSFLNKKNPYWSSEFIRVLLNDKIFQKLYKKDKAIET